MRIARGDREAEPASAHHAERGARASRRFCAGAEKSGLRTRLTCWLRRPTADIRRACVRERRADGTLLSNAEAQRESVEARRGKRKLSPRPSLFFSAPLRKTSGHPASIAAAPRYVSAAKMDPTASHTGTVNEATGWKPVCHDRRRRLSSVRLSTLNAHLSPFDFSPATRA